MHIGATVHVVAALTSGSKRGHQQYLPDGRPSKFRSVTHDIPADEDASARVTDSDCDFTHQSPSAFDSSSSHGTSLHRTVVDLVSPILPVHLHTPAACRPTSARAAYASDSISHPHVHRDRCVIISPSISSPFQAPRMAVCTVPVDASESADADEPRSASRASFCAADSGLESDSDDVQHSHHMRGSIGISCTASAFASAKRHSLVEAAAAAMRRGISEADEIKLHELTVENERFQSVIRFTAGEYDVELRGILAQERPSRRTVTAPRDLISVHPDQLEQLRDDTVNLSTASELSSSDMMAAAFSRPSAEDASDSRPPSRARGREDEGHLLAKLLTMSDESGAEWKSSGLFSQANCDDLVVRIVCVCSGKPRSRKSAAADSSKRPRRQLKSGSGYATHTKLVQCSAATNWAKVDGIWYLRSHNMNHCNHAAPRAGDVVGAKVSDLTAAQQNAVGFMVSDQGLGAQGRSVARLIEELLGRNIHIPAEVITQLKTKFESQNLEQMIHEAIQQIAVRVTAQGRDPEKVFKTGVHVGIKSHTNDLILLSRALFVLKNIKFMIWLGPPDVSHLSQLPAFRTYEAIRIRKDGILPLSEPRMGIIAENKALFSECAYSVQTDEQFDAHLQKSADIDMFGVSDESDDDDRSLAEMITNINTVNALSSLADDPLDDEGDRGIALSSQPRVRRDEDDADFKLNDNGDESESDQSIDEHSHVSAVSRPIDFIPLKPAPFAKLLRENPDARLCHPSFGRHFYYDLRRVPVAAASVNSDLKAHKPRIHQSVTFFTRVFLCDTRRRHALAMANGSDVHSGCEQLLNTQTIAGDLYDRLGKNFNFRNFVAYLSKMRDEDGFSLIGSEIPVVLDERVPTLNMNYPVAGSIDFALFRSRDVNDALVRVCDLKCGARPSLTDSAFQYLQTWIAQANAVNGDAHAVDTAVLFPAGSNSHLAHNVIQLNLYALALRTKLGALRSAARGTKIPFAFRTELTLIYGAPTANQCAELHLHEHNLVLSDRVLHCLIQRVAVTIESVKSFINRIGSPREMLCAAFSDPNELKLFQLYPFVKKTDTTAGKVAENYHILNVSGRTAFGKNCVPMFALVRNLQQTCINFALGNAFKYFVPERTRQAINICITDGNVQLINAIKLSRAKGVLNKRLLLLACVYHLLIVGQDKRLSGQGIPPRVNKTILYLVRAGWTDCECDADVDRLWPVLEGYVKKKCTNPQATVCLQWTDGLLASGPTWMQPEIFRTEVRSFDEHSTSSVESEFRVLTSMGVNRRTTFSQAVLAQCTIFSNRHKSREHDLQKLSQNHLMHVSAPLRPLSEQLTPYGFLLLLDQFNMHTKYKCVQLNAFQFEVTWDATATRAAHVSSNPDGFSMRDMDGGDGGKQPVFDHRVRIVTVFSHVVDGQVLWFLFCSCKLWCRVLTACRHIICVKCGRLSEWRDVHFHYSMLHAQNPHPEERDFTDGPPGPSLFGVKFDPRFESERLAAKTHERPAEMPSAPHAGNGSRSLVRDREQRGATFAHDSDSSSLDEIDGMSGADFDIDAYAFENAAQSTRAGKMSESRRYAHAKSTLEPFFEELCARIAVPSGERFFHELRAQRDRMAKQIAEHKTLFGESRRRKNMPTSQYAHGHTGSKQRRRLKKSISERSSSNAPVTRSHRSTAVSSSAKFAAAAANLLRQRHLTRAAKGAIARPPSGAVPPRAKSARVKDALVRKKQLTQLAEAEMRRVLEEKRVARIPEQKLVDMAEERTRMATLRRRLISLQKTPTDGAALREASILAKFDMNRSALVVRADVIGTLIDMLGQRLFVDNLVTFDSSAPSKLFGLSAVVLSEVTQYLSDELIMSFVNCVCLDRFPSHHNVGGRVVALDTGLIQPDIAYDGHHVLHDYVWDSSPCVLSARQNGHSHLLSHLVLWPVRLPGMFHHVLYVINHRSRTIMALDPLGPTRSLGQRAMKMRADVVDRINAFLQYERVQAKFDPQSAYALVEQPDSLPRQTDGSSCGVFTAIFAYWIATHQTCPTSADFAGRDTHALQLVVLDWTAKHDGDII